MKKSDILAKIANCQAMVEQIIVTGKLSRKQTKALNKILTTILQDKAYANQLVEGAPDLNAIGTRYVELEKTLQAMQHEVSSVANTKQKVVETIPAERQKPTTQKQRDGILNKSIKVLLAILLAIAIAIAGSALFQMWNNDDDELDRPGYEQSIDDEDKELTIEDINLDDFGQLLEFATKIEEDISDPEIGKEDIIYAIRLANFDNLQDKAIFKDRDEVVGSAYYIGQMSKDIDVNSLLQKDANSDIFLSEDEMTHILLCSTNLELTLEDFADAKTPQGYDVYVVAQKCVKVFNSNDERAFNFCKVFNDLLARHALAFSIIEDCPISTYYVLAGMYTANKDRILELTAGQTLGPIYGDGTRIDGTYGFICVEELEALLRINHGQGEFVGNENCALYTFVIDENITSYTADEDRGR